MKNQPSKITRWFLELFIDNCNHDSLFGDFEEMYQIYYRENGRIRASLWLWSQIIKSIPAFIINPILWSIFMFKNYLKTAFRNIKRQKGYTFINIAGLAIGIATVTLIMLYIQFELSFDRYHKNADQIFRVILEFPEYYQGQNRAAISPAPLAAALVDDFPEVISATRFRPSDDVLLSYGQKRFFENNFCFTDPATFDIFSFELLLGDPETALNAPNSIIISEQMAEKYFGNEEPLGKILNYEDRYDFQVTGVLKKIPQNSHFTMDFVAPFETYGEITGSDFTRWGISGYYTYFLLRRDADPVKLESKLSAFLEKYWDEKHDVHDRYFIQPLTEIHLHSNLMAEITANNDIKYIYLLASIAFLILIIACINYMNLATARSVQRGKEVGVRKVIGAQRNQLVRQFFCESMILTIIALLVSILLINLALPAFNLFVEREMAFNITTNFQLVLWVFVLMVFIGLFAGGYPALAISSFKPVAVLTGKFKGGSKGTMLRNTLVVIQFAISIILIISTVVVRNQLDYIKNRNVGYKRDQIVVLTVRDTEARKNIEAIKTELLNSPNILSAASSRYLPNRIGAQGIARWPGKPKDLELPIYASTVDYDFIGLFEIKIVKGRNFSRKFPSDANGAFLLNEAAVKALGWEIPVGRDFYHTLHHERGSGKIVGVMKDFHLHSLHQKIEPLYFFLDPNKKHSYLSLKIRANNIPETIAFIEDKMKVFSPKYPFDYNFFDVLFDQAYKSERKIESMFRTFALIAILIACLGLFSLASFTIEQRSKEIGIRKVLGASVIGIVRLLSKEFLKWVLIANIVAWPVAYFTMNKWLQDFAFKTDLSFFTFLVSALVALGIAFLTIGYQALKAAIANPVEALRYE